MDRIDVIRKSMSVFVCGLLGLCPLIGVPFGVVALALFVSVWQRKVTEWNPAGQYLDWGVRFALLGFIISFVAVVMILLVIINQTSQPTWDGGYID